MQTQLNMRSYRGYSRMIIHVCRCMLILFICLFLIGCNEVFEQHEPDDPRFAPSQPEIISVPIKNNGSIYQDSSAIVLFETIRARHVGDILTVNLNENTNAFKRAATISKKDYAAESKSPTLYGTAVQFNLPKFLPLASTKDNNLEFELEGNRKFDGQGESRQNNQLNGSISVTVYQVLSNGNLKVRGEKWLQLNQGKEFIRLTGIVRPADIAPDNSISSLRIADARITYSGTGDVADSNTMGWLSRFFNSVFWMI